MISYTARLDEIQTTLDSTNDAIALLQAYDGSVTLASGEVTSGGQIENETLALMAQHENLTRQGIAAWENIQSLTLLITEANGDVQVR